MSDKDIIKALECCNKGECNICPYDDHNKIGGLNVKFFDDKCKPHIVGDALDLINRQKAEIEEKNELIERLQNANVRALRGTTETVKANARTEAIKDFAERLKNMLTACSYTLDGEREYLVRDYDIDNLVKEMVGEQT